VPCETRHSDSGSDRGQQRIVATDIKSDRSSDKIAGSNTAGTACLHLQVLCNATSQRGMFPEISHSQALLGALVSFC
jgi:hypothetical protein